MQIQEQELLEHIFDILSEGIIERAAKNQMKASQDVVDYIHEWQELLTSNTSYGANECLGLWGELYYILSSCNIDKAVSVWNGPSRKKFDFSGPGIDLEIKTSLKGHRHIFSEE